eukprot:TRINITY_DN7015_c1_g1_i1.p1 TRINITY_DN7015_c1_g1~~TRINITY_DN7015_c1_g1_i1.p1  ORF type:complete len:431 (-),score=133.01 TRINITY_DN7015_c1_g1_i1:1535-2827(-)
MALPLMSDGLSSVIIDVGSYSVKAGFAGEDTPRVLVPTCVGTSMKSRARDDAMDVSSFGGAIATSRVIDIGLASLCYPLDGREIASPLQDGLVSDWEAVEALWGHVLHKQLQVSPKETPVMLVEPAHNTKKIRATMTELMFEKYEVPALFLGKDAALNTFAFANEKKTPGTALVVDVGHFGTRVVPVYEGYVQHDAIQTSKVGGQRVTEEWTKYIEETSQIPITPLYAIGKKEVAPAKFEVTVHDYPNLAPSFHRYHVHRVVEDLKSLHGHINIAADDISSELIPPVSFALPDGKVLDVGGERFRIPEMILNPSACDPALPSLLEMIGAAIEASAADARRDLLTNVLLTGGSSRFEGFEKRLRADIEAFNDERQLYPGKTKVVAPQRAERAIGSWMGGSVLASLGDNIKMWMSKAEFEERGSDLVDRKCP